MPDETLRYDPHSGSWHYPEHWDADTGLSAELDRRIGVTPDCSWALARPDGDPAAFATRVAAAYEHALIQDAKRPAQLIAAASGVPVTTVHRWIREARLRGALSPATNAYERVAADLGVPIDALRRAVAKHGRLEP